MNYQYRLLLPAILFFALFAPSLMATHEATEPSDGTINSFRWLQKPIPLLGEVLVHDDSGSTISLSQFKGKVVLINLWASWCPPCVRELPALERLQKRLGGEDFTVVAISLDKNQQLAREMFIDRLAITHLDLYMQRAEQIGQFFPVDVLPANFVLNSDGEALGMLRSYVDWDDPQVDIFFKRIIANIGSGTQ